MRGLRITGSQSASLQAGLPWLIYGSFVHRHICQVDHVSSRGYGGVYPGFIGVYLGMSGFDRVYLNLSGFVRVYLSLTGYIWAYLSRSGFIGD